MLSERNISRFITCSKRWQKANTIFLKEEKENTGGKALGTIFNDSFFILLYPFLNFPIKEEYCLLESFILNISKYILYFKRMINVDVYNRIRLNWINSAVILYDNCNHLSSNKERSYMSARRYGNLKIIFRKYFQQKGEKNFHKI